MRIVLPGALPDPHEARELVTHLERSAPTLASWFRRARAQSHLADPASTGCTPFEYWQLMQKGFTPAPGKNFATGLGPLYAGPAQHANQAIWLVELVHVSPSRDGAALLPAAELDIDPQHSVALLESVHSMAAESGFSFLPCTTGQWLCTLPPHCTPDVVASPAVVSLSSVNDWWKQDAASRPWRKLVNEVQMLWFDHPVNQQRYQRQQVPINSLWLFGGASPEQLAIDTEQTDTHVIDTLCDAANRHDWGVWLQELERLEATVFSKHAQGPMPGLVLTGSQRIVTLHSPGGLLARLLHNKTSWRSWWSPQP